jgi:hypothetical protein
MSIQTLPQITVPGTLTFILDASFGSSGKGKLSAFLTKKGCFSFLVTSNSANASHTVIDGDKKVVFKALPSGSFYHEMIDKVFISPGASFRIEDLLAEMRITGIPRHKVVIHPRATVITDEDAAFERGEVDLDGNPYTHSGTVSTGSTCSGSGAALARKILRRKPAVASDYFEIEDLIGVTEQEIMELLDQGKCGLFEIGQGFPLSLNHHRFAPNTTSRNVTVSAALNDSLLPPVYAGPVLLNFRTFPIRINSKKYIGLDDSHLTWDQVKDGVPHEVIESYSGSWYPDQEEITWEEVEENIGRAIPDAVKNTTLTKLPRRIATFSSINLSEAIKYNMTQHGVFLSINFMNHVSSEVEDSLSIDTIISDDKAWDWVESNIPPCYRDSVAFYGTGHSTDSFAVDELARASGGRSVFTRRSNED